ncbi:MAG: hypothetical protein H6834_09015 [Planctomycetes bacterium]|nr:hypothetical protein [Planctomycetota bacterium]
MRWPSASLLALLLAGCAFPPQEINLAPLVAYDDLGPKDHLIEFLGGIASQGMRDGREHLAFRPLFYTEHEGDRNETDVLWPIGYHQEDAEESKLRIFPLVWSFSRLNDLGERDRDWAVLPFFLGGTARGEDYFAFFPFFGTLRNFITFDEISFVAFPFWVTHRKADRSGWAILWPLIAKSSGDGYEAFRFLPFYTERERQGKFWGQAILWPFFNRTATRLDKEDPESSLLIPLVYGRQERGSYRATSIAWPFIGWASDEKTGFSSFQLWPFVRIVRNGPGEGQAIERSSVLPFYLHYRSKEIESRCFAWPLIWIREEWSPDVDLPVEHKASTFVLPFWQDHRLTRTEKDGTITERTYTQAWPLGHDLDELDGSGVTQVFSPMPFRRVHEVFERNWNPFFTLWRAERTKRGDRMRRSFLGIYRELHTADEHRVSLPILFGHRWNARGRREWSFLAGLLRFRTDDGFTLLAPRFPGPGFDLTETDAEREERP